MIDFSGNFLFSFRPEIKDHMRDLKTFRVDWSDDLEGGKAFRLSGIFDKLSYRVRKALSVESMKCSFATAHCSLQSDGQLMGQLHFLIQSITRYVPVVQPDNFEHTSEIRNSPVALQEQKQIFLLPTVRISNLLHSEIHVLLSEIGNGIFERREITFPPPSPFPPVAWLNYSNVCSHFRNYGYTLFF